MTNVIQEKDEHILDLKGPINNLVMIDSEIPSSLFCLRGS